MEAAVRRAHRRVEMSAVEARKGVVAVEDVAAVGAAVVDAAEMVGAV